MRAGILFLGLMAAAPQAALAADSAYTKFDWEKCRKTGAEDDVVMRRCDGPDGIAVDINSGEDAAFECLHHLRVGGALMVEALRVQCAVHEQVRVVIDEGYALRRRLAGDDRRADDDVGDDDRRTLVAEGEHVGRVVLAAVVAVQCAALVGADDAHREFGRRRRQRRAQLARDRMARQQRAVRRVGELQRKLQRRPRCRARCQARQAPAPPRSAAS